MAMNTGQQAQINVTPMIDVLLVLLIIFMAISPTKSIGLDAKVPQPSTAEAPPTPDSDLVISIAADGKLQLNSRALSREELLPTLQQALAIQPSRAVFLKGAKDLEYASVVAVLDTVHEAGVERVGLVGRALAGPPSQKP